MDFVLATSDHHAAASLLPGGLFSDAAPAPWAVVATDGGFAAPMSGSKCSNDDADNSSGLSRSVESRASGSDNGAASSLGHEAAAVSSASSTTAPTAAQAPPAPRPAKAKVPAVTAVALEALLAASPNADAMCPAGIEVGVYNSDMSQHHAIPSEHVQITRGAIKYVDHHARYGAQTRFRFQLCHNFLLRKCPKLSECSYIHATQLPAPTQVHLNPFAPRRLAADRHGRSNEVALSAQDDPAVTNAYERLAPGTTLQVHPPQGNQVSADVTVVASEDVFLTVGATDALKQLAAADGDVSRIEGPPPRHCTKFQYRRACPAGPTCKGIHSAVPFAGTSLAALHQTQPSRPSGNQPPLRGAAQPFRGAAPATTRPPPPVPTALPPAFVPMQGAHPMMVPMVFDPSQTQQPQYAPQAFAVYPQSHGAHNGFPMPVSQVAGSWGFQPQQHAPMAQWVSPPTA